MDDSSTPRTNDLPDDSEKGRRGPPAADEEEDPVGNLAFTGGYIPTEETKQKHLARLLKKKLAQLAKLRGGGRHHTAQANIHRTADTASLDSDPDPGQARQDAKNVKPSFKQRMKNMAKNLAIMAAAKAIKLIKKAIAKAKMMAAAIRDRAARTRAVKYFAGAAVKEVKPGASKSAEGVPLWRRALNLAMKAKAGIMKAMQISPEDLQYKSVLVPADKDLDEITGEV